MQRSPRLVQIEKWEHQMYFEQRSVALCDDPSAAPSRVGASFAADRPGDEIVQLSACALSDLIASFLAKPGQDWACLQLAYAYKQATRWTSTRPLEAVSLAGKLIDGSDCT